MDNKPNALGKGLDAIFSDRKVDLKSIESSPARESLRIPIEKIRTNPKQPREAFDPGKLEELAASIKEKGIIQPVSVAKEDDGYILISGERRLRAARLAGLQDIPAYIYERSAKLTDEELLELALIENIQREDLNPMELSDSYKRLSEEHHLTQEQIAARVSKQRSTVANYLRLQNLPVEIKISLRKSEITEAHARLLLSIDNEEDRLTLWKKILSENLTVKSLENFTKPLAGKQRKKKQKLGEIYDPHLQNIEDKLRNFFGTKVTIRRKTKHSGEIVIDYFSNDDLERIIDKCI